MIQTQAKITVHKITIFFIALLTVMIAVTSLFAETGTITPCLKPEISQRLKGLAMAMGVSARKPLEEHAKR